MTLKKPSVILLAAALAFAGIQTVSAQTLLLHYDFNEASSGTTPALDGGTGNPVNGTFEGGATRTGNTPANFSVGALNMSAAGDHVVGGDDAKFDGLSQFTLTAWVNLQADPVNHRLMSKQSGGAFPGFSWQIIDPASGTKSASNFGLRMFVGGSTDFAHDNQPGNGGNFDADDKWLFVAVTYDGTLTADNVNYYFGDAAAGVALSHTTTVNAGPVTDHAGRFMVGRTDAAPAANTNPIGFMDDVRVYNGLVSLAQLEEIRLANIPEPSTCALLGGALALLLAFRRFRKPD